ncbi:MAG: 2-dehydropantoate 2-reductase [Gammaproteobacteria bacterium]|nr:2-dehydropantoate 2-reductase [Gammaproteobacteria bacterium]MDH3448499.1 2-dehydropantoate 2-reductase [Gammaproteobacteria bacterium]
MKVCVVGAGAIGGMMAVKLAQSGHELSVIARGAHLDAIRKNGLKYIENGAESVVTDIFATADMESITGQDIVLLGVKAHQIEPIADRLTGMLSESGVIVTLQNGIPWWYFQKLEGEYRDRIVRTVDPDGAIAAAIDPDRIIGCIAFPAATIDEPGVIRHIEGNRFPVGELDGSASERVQAICDAFVEAGFKSFVLPDIRSEIWLKLWGNLSFNPISALTHATLVDICRFPQTRALAAQMMTEAQQIAEKLGASFRVSLERRIEGAEAVGKHKTSMLQDLELGKALEIDGMLGVVIELGEQTNTPTPAINVVYALVSLLHKNAQEAGIKIAGQPV